MTYRLPAAAVRRLVLTGCLLVCVLGIFTVVRVASGLDGGASPSPAVLLLATALVAVLVPLGRPAAERLADRVAYGRDGDPYAAVTRFVSRIADALAVDEVLPHVAQAASAAMHGERSEVRLWLADGAEWRQTWPPNNEEVVSRLAVPLQHGGSTVGRLGLDVADDDLGPTDKELLNRLVGPAGLALSNVQLTFELRRRLAEATVLAEQLRRSRERLVLARGEQRRRFAATVRDRVQARLAAADAALTAGGPTAAACARGEVLAALEALRAIAAGVFPPALDDSGLSAALELYVNRGPGIATLRVELPTGRVHNDVAAAAYFCCTTLLDDAVSDGMPAEPGDIAVTTEGPVLVLDVRAPVPAAPDTLQLVRDRAEAIGGTVEVSTNRVLVLIPAGREDDGS